MATTLTTVTKAWRDFNLSSFQTELDEVATELAQRIDASESSRKILVDQNKEFKKNSSLETKKQVAPLLKNFQTEIDSLTKRSKAAEAAFLNVYQRVVEAPDPSQSLEFVQSLQTKASKVADLELENGKLKETLSEYTKEFAEIKNQEVTINRLRERLKELEDSVESRVSARLGEKERELSKSYEEKNQLIASSQIDLEKRLNESEHNSHALQSAYNAAQAELFELRSRLDDEQSAKNSEMELVLTDLEVANQKLASAEKDIMDLHSQLSEAQSMIDRQAFNPQADSHSEMEEAFHRLANSSMEAELLAKERQIEQLVEENRKLGNSVTNLKETADLQRHKHQQDYCALENQIEAMKEKLDSQRDYAEIKRELDIMKSVEFNFSSPDSKASAEDPGSGGNSQQPDLISGSVAGVKQSLELLLLEKNKKLQNEATAWRNNNASLQERVTSLELDLRTSKRTVEEQTTLIGQLEQDLLSVNSQFSKFRTEGDGAPNPNVMPLVEKGPGGVGNISGETEFLSEQKLLAVAVQEKIEENEPENTLLSIVSSQRERFKLRNQELEAENKGYQQIIGVLRNDCDKLRADNVQLYEKIRYLQTYNTGGLHPSNKTSDSTVESRYSADYESRLDPFTTFSQRERHRKYANLTTVEKVVLNVGQLIFSNRKARIMAFCYAMLLHALVFMVLYRFSLGASDIRDLSQDCQTQFASHMRDFHGDEVAADQVLGGDRHFLPGKDPPLDAALPNAFR